MVDSLLNEINNTGVTCINYAGDVAILVQGKFDAIVSDIVSRVWNWCQKKGLFANLNKTKLIAFPNIRKVQLKVIKLCGCEMENSKYINYLGGYFDEKLSWNTI